MALKNSDKVGHFKSTYWYTNTDACAACTDIIRKVLTSLLKRLFFKIRFYYLPFFFFTHLLTKHVSCSPSFVRTTGKCLWNLNHWPYTCICILILTLKRQNVQFSFTIFIHLYTTKIARYNYGLGLIPNLYHPNI